MNPWENDPVSDTPWEKDSIVDNNQGVMPFVNKAIAGTVGAPVDLFTGGLNLIPGVDIKEPIGGSKSIERGMSAIGIDIPDRDPKTIPEHIGQSVGEVSSLMLPMGAGVKAISKGTGLAANVAKTVWKSIAKHPYLAMTSEVTGGVGAGTGRGIGEQEFPESPTAQATSELAGGIIGGMAPTAAVHTPATVALRGGKTLLRKISLPFTKKGTEYRAGEFLKGLVADPAKTAQVVSEQTISDLPPAVASGEKRLVTLYKSLIGQDPKVDADAVEDLSKSIVKLEGEMRKLGHGSPEVLAEITKKRVAALELKMDQRVMTAMERAQEKIEALPVAQRKVDESRIVRTELEGVMRAEQEQVRNLWQEVPKDLKVGFDNTRQSYITLLDDLSQAQMSDVPAVLRRNAIITNDKLKSTTLKEMQGLRSKLLETARKARKEGQWNKARIADEVSDAILLDLGIASEGAATPEAASLQAALAATRQFKTRFESGITGKILGYSKSGAPAIDPDLTLDISIGRMGTKGSIDIEKVAVTPEALKATERYLGRSYTDYALDKGIVNPVKSERWIRNNEAILDKFPELRNQLTDASKAQGFATKTKSAMDARKAALRDPKISTAAKFVNAADMNVEVAAILKSNNPSRMVKDLMSKAKGNVDAIEGLRAGFIDHILEKSSIGAYNELGEQSLSGRTLLGFVNKNQSVMEQMFTKDQVSRMRKVGSELAKIEAFESARAGKPEMEMKDVASTALRMISRVQFARLGGFMGKQSMGGSLQMANIYAKEGEALAVKFTKDRAAQLVQDAILSKDPKLLNALLLPLDKPSSAAFNWRVVNGRINLWLAGTGGRVAEDIKQEIKNEKPVQKPEKQPIDDPLGLFK